MFDSPETGVISRIQNRLELLYDVSIDHDASDFVITDPAFPRAVENADTFRFAREKLLLMQNADELLISLFLEPGIVDALNRTDPLDELDDDNLEDFCLALEGVSHFLYLIWNAGRERALSRLELELQAEVDKYAMISALRAQQRSSLDNGIHSRLFAESRLAPDLSPADRSMYLDASHYAGKFCYQIECIHLQSGRNDRIIRWLADLRDFYRLDLGAKIRHIETRPSPH
jgi:hypothetical protein